MLAKLDLRTKSHLVRKMVRVYGRNCGERNREGIRWITRIIEEPKAEQEKNPVSTEDILKQSDRLCRCFARPAKKFGIKP